MNGIAKLMASRSRIISRPTSCCPPGSYFAISHFRAGDQKRRAKILNSLENQSTIASLIRRDAYLFSFLLLSA
jgi:hypothetical protein